MPLRLPPLRERLEDIPLLVQAFAARTARETGKRAPAIDPATIELLQRYNWPGNVREPSERAGEGHGPGSRRNRR